VSEELIGEVLIVSVVLSLGALAFYIWGRFLRP